MDVHTSIFLTSCSVSVTYFTRVSCNQSKYINSALADLKQMLIYNHLSMSPRSNPDIPNTTDGRRWYFTPTWPYMVRSCKIDPVMCDIKGLLLMVREISWPFIHKYVSLFSTCINYHCHKQGFGMWHCGLHLSEHMCIRTAIIIRVIFQDFVHEKGGNQILFRLRHSAQLVSTSIIEWCYEWAHFPAYIFVYYGIMTHAL